MSDDDNGKKVADEAEKSLEQSDEAAAAADAGAPQGTESDLGASEEAKGNPPPTSIKTSEAEKKDEHVAQGEENLVAEADRVNVGVIGMVTFVIMVAVVGTVIGVYSFFGETFRGEIDKKQLSVEDPTLREIHAMEQAHLTKYQWVDQAKGMVRIPKDRAKELVLAEYAKMPAYQPGVAAPAPSASAPAPSASTEVAPAGSASAMPSASASAAPSGAPSSAPSHTAPAPSASAPTKK